MDEVLGALPPLRAAGSLRPFAAVFKLLPATCPPTRAIHGLRTGIALERALRPRMARPSVTPRPGLAHVRVRSAPRARNLSNQSPRAGAGRSSLPPRPLPSVDARRAPVAPPDHVPSRCRYCAIVRARPSASGTVGSKPRRATRFAAAALGASDREPTRPALIEPTMRVNAAGRRGTDNSSSLRLRRVPDRRRRQCVAARKAPGVACQGIRS